MQFGSKSRFAAELGSPEESHTGLRRIDLWAANQWLTCNDNQAYLPSFTHYLGRTIEWLRTVGHLPAPLDTLPMIDAHRLLAESCDVESHGDVGEHHIFPQLTEITDNVLGYLFRKGSSLVFTFEFWRETHPHPEDVGKVFAVELSESELLSVFEGLLKALNRE